MSGHATKMECSAEDSSSPNCARRITYGTKTRSTESSPEQFVKPASYSYQSVVQTIKCKAYRCFLKRETVELNFEAEGTIGNGTFGKVHRIAGIYVNGTSLDEGANDKRYALKIVQQEPQYCHRELETLEELRDHPNIINLIFSYFTRYDNKIYLNLITTLLGHTLFFKIYQDTGKRAGLKKTEPPCFFADLDRISGVTGTSPHFMSTIPCFHIQERRVRRWSMHILRGLDFMHAKMIIHRDLKPENVAFTAQGVAQLIDMGSAKKLRNDGQINSTEICTLVYRAPELLLGNGNYVDCGMDIWAFGLIMLEMITGRPVFYGSNKTSHFEAIMNVLGRPPKRLTMNTGIDIYKIICKHDIEKQSFQIQTQLRRLVPHLNVIENIQHQDIELMIMSMLKYENRSTATELLRHRYFVDEPMNESTSMSN